MKEFNRSDDYMAKIFLDALDQHVIMDAQITFHRVNGKLKAFSKKTKTYLQFPRDLRREGRILIADIIKASNSRGTVFYRYYRGSIRDQEGNVLR